MSIRSQVELDNTRRKLRMLEEDCEALRHDPNEDEHIRELTQESLQRLINQFKEEIARYEAHQPSRR